ncbi:hypothetical protein GOBAR_AA02002 [Gossypium barbadense]|uniref:Uncharacterized protein n=1 Tax=Gossypium barbadense TaxID=3634 RepID=A0A2P5YSL0_GOSBA|nr:hypothetical protein GOBAR_AA02002 [Gossypium barbadense]
MVVRCDLVRGSVVAGKKEGERGKGADWGNVRRGGGGWGLGGWLEKRERGVGEAGGRTTDGEKEEGSAADRVLGYFR